MSATITSIAHYVPPDVYPNSYFENYLDTSDEWITSRTGIKERRFAKSGATSDLIIPAAKECIERRGIDMQEIDCILVPTVTPDYFFPSTACIVQNKLGINNVWGFDISAACSSFIFGLATATKLVESGLSKKLLLCGADKMSSILNLNDRNQAVLFGDGAGVALIEQSNDPELGILDSIMYINGEGQPALNMPAGGSAKPATIETVKNNEHYIHQDGQTVFKAAVKGMADVSVDIMKKNGITSKELNWLVPHQANLRIINATADRMELEREKVMINIDKYGNTTAGTIPICLSEWNAAGNISKGDRLVLSSFGAGYTWGSIYMRWNMND